MKTKRHIGNALTLAGAFGALLVASVGSAQAAQEEVRVMTQRPANTTAPMVLRQGAESRSVTVSYADLDMRRAAGANTLYTRLRTAAHSVCSPKPHRGLEDRRDWNRCYSEALDEAVSATGSGELSALHLARTGRNVSTDIASRN
jgi:UrcA family protein